MKVSMPSMMRRSPNLKDRAGSWAAPYSAPAAARPHRAGRAARRRRRDPVRPPEPGHVRVLRFAFVWIGVYLGLRFYPNPEAVTAVRTLEFPIGFLGNPFVAVSTMPAWLGAIAVWNPLSSTATAARQLFGDPTGATSSWITSHAIIMAIAWPLLLTAAFFSLSLHRYQRLSR